MRKEYSLGIVLLILAIGITINNRFKKENTTYTYKDTIEFTESNDFRKDISYSQAFVFAINDKVCPACLANVDEYIDLIEQENPSRQVIIAYLSNNSSKTDRFTEIMGWNKFPRKLIKEPTDLRNKLIFMDHNEVISISLIPNNRMTSIERKKNILAEHLSMATN